MKILSVVLVAIIAGYPTLELTRLILWQLDHPEVYISYRLQQLWEIPIYWALYLIAMTLVYKIATDKGAADPW